MFSLIFITTFFFCYSILIPWRPYHYRMEPSRFGTRKTTVSRTKSSVGCVSLWYYIIVKRQHSQPTLFNVLLCVCEAASSILFCLFALCAHVATLGGEGLPFSYHLKSIAVAWCRYLGFTHIATYHTFHYIYVQSFCGWMPYTCHQSHFSHFSKLIDHFYMLCK